MIVRKGNLKFSEWACTLPDSVSVGSILISRLKGKDLRRYHKLDSILHSQDADRAIAVINMVLGEGKNEMAAEIVSDVLSFSTRVESPNPPASSSPSADRVYSAATASSSTATSSNSFSLPFDASVYDATQAAEKFDVNSDLPAIDTILPRWSAPSFDPHTGADTTAPAVDPNTPANISFAEYVAIGEAIDAIRDLPPPLSMTFKLDTILHNIQDAQTNTATSIRNIEVIMTNLTQQPSIQSPTTETPTFELPDKFKGKAADVEYFIREVKDTIELLGLSLPSDRQKCIWMARLLGDGSPKQWYFSIMTSEPELLNSFDNFIQRFKDHFGDSNLEYNAEMKLKKLKQTGSASAYASRFSELVVHVDRSESTKINQFYTNLKTAKGNVMNWVIDIDNRVHEREEEGKEESPSKSSFSPSKPAKTSNSHTTPPSNNSTSNSSLPPGEPMQVDATKTGKPHPKLSDEEKKRRKDLGLCVYCGKCGKDIDNCPNRSPYVVKRMEAAKAARASSQSRKA
ncbi:hypothetical protein D9758_017252 [Tetrapyrgos nigripes]|uniref:4Fe-4S ferredoxin-type domain-containing protein n=1 Tax=Tetrapyrgos nigripes TaxID=182062 RepID=A0A8H5C435_9AGAR|nr:hypothetical protein D9758_017252 [Tetrapyrgos nigripes]